MKRNKLIVCYAFVPVSTFFILVYCFSKDVALEEH